MGGGPNKTYKFRSCQIRKKKIVPKMLTVFWVGQKKFEQNNSATPIGTSKLENLQPRCLKIVYLYQ